MKPFLRSGDFWSGLALAALGTYIVVCAHRWEYMTEEGPGAGFFPTWYGALMLVLSLALALGAVVKPRERAQVAWQDVSRAITAWIGFVACIAVMPFLGFTVSLALLTVFIVKVMCGQTLRRALAVAIPGALGFYALFQCALDLSLPAGWLF